jgi:hypothetical protein
VGHDPQEFAAEGVDQITAINTSATLPGSNGWDGNKLQVILAVGALALVFPVLVFVGTAARLSAARREQRFAAMRLVGATPRQISVVSAVEASVAAFGGVIVGFAVFFAFRPELARVPFTGEPFAQGDLRLSIADVLLVVIGVPIVATIAARVAMRRVQISPLGVSRRVTPPPPRAYRLIPLVAGIAELTYFVAVGRPSTTGGQIDAYFSGCLLIMVGLVVAGPWLAMTGARLMARRAGRPSVLIAGRRIADNPRGAFRAISGLIIALFVTSVSVGVITTVMHDQVGTGGTAAGSTLVTHIDGPSSDAGLQSALSHIGSMSGVKGVATLHAESSTRLPEPFETGLISCDEIARTPALGRCATGAQVAQMRSDVDNASAHSLEHTVWPAANVSATQLAALPIEAVAVATNGSRSTLEGVRTFLETANPNGSLPVTIGELDAQSLRVQLELRQLTNMVIVVSLVIAGCSLAVTVVAGINERKRPFSLLRLSGVPLKSLRRVITLETAVPLLLVAVVSVAMGFVAAALFLQSQLGERLEPPGSAYYATVAAGLLASLAIIASTFPLIERITGPETARNE